MKSALLAAPILIASALSASAVNLIVPTDAIIGGRSDGTNFIVGGPGSDGGNTNYADNVWPAAEPPTDLINGVIGGGGEKYLNFAELNTGVIITPTAGLSLINTMTLWVANDAVERDPASFSLYGTTAAVPLNPATGTAIPISSFTLIAGDSLSLPDTRDTVADGTGFNEVVSIGSGTAYTAYLLLFPTVKGEPTANSMQISELQFDATLVPEPGSAALAAAALGLFLRRRR